MQAFKMFTVLFVSSVFLFYSPAIAESTKEKPKEPAEKSKTLNPKLKIASKELKAKAVKDTRASKHGKLYCNGLEDGNDGYWYYYRDARYQQNDVSGICGNDAKYIKKDSGDEVRDWNNQCSNGREEYDVSW